MTSIEIARSEVQEYYGKVLSGTSDLQTGACCTGSAAPNHIRDILKQIEPEVVNRFYGCGSPIPPAIANRTVLDLGSGTGRDAYVCAKLVGPTGKVIGVDMTEEQLDVARRNRDAQMQRFGFTEPNIDFRSGYIEDLQSAGVEDASVDVVISNCVINLSPKKRQVFAEIFRVLKPGGELYFSDVFADRRVPAELYDDPVLRGECLSGALYVEDFRRMMQDLGCADYRVVAQSPVALNNPIIAQRIGMVRFFSLTVRAFKLDNLEDICEDYGQVATYRGTILESPHRFVLDDHHEFVAHKPMLVCGNTAAMVQDTRFNEHFEVTGDRSRHFGVFGCREHRLTSDETDAPAGACC